MAKIREIKKEVNFLINEIIDDCNSFMAYHPDKSEKAVKLVEEAVALRNRLVEKINHPEKVSNNYYKELRNQLITEADAIFEKLRGMIK